MQERPATTHRQASCIPAAAVLLAVLFSRNALGQQQIEGVEVLPVNGSVYALMGAGGNITLSLGPDGVLLVDTGLAEAGERVLSAIHELQREQGYSKPIRYLINTHYHADHTGGNAVLAEAGRTFTGGNVVNALADVGERATIWAHENVLFRMIQPPAGSEPFPADAYPTENYIYDRIRISHFFNGEGIEILHQPAAHTDGDSFVVFRGSDVIAAGDIFSTETYPIIDSDAGGSINGVLAALNRLLDLAVPDFRYEGGTLVVPGHGRISDSADVAYYRDMVTIIRDRIQHMIDEGMTLEEVLDAKPTFDYDSRYNAPGRWTTEQFVNAVYTDLSRH